MVSGQNLNLSKPSCIFFLPVEMKMIPSKMKALEWSQHFSHYKCMGIFPDTRGQLNPQSLVQSGQISNSFEMLRMPLFTCKNKEDPIKNVRVRVVTRFSPVITLMELSVTMETRVLIRSGPKLNPAVHPHPNDASVKI